MQGIAHGAGIDYDKILFLNTLTTLSEKGNCFAFSFRDGRGRIITARQADLSPKQRLWKKMLLYIIKPQKGNGFMALLNPGWVSGETGMNERGLTVSENNIHIDQTQWGVMPITHLSRYLLQYSNTIDDVERVLKTQAHYPVRLLFVSSPKGASIYELANSEMARVVMQGEFLAVANNAGAIPSKNISAGIRIYCPIRTSSPTNSWIP